MFTGEKFEANVKWDFFLWPQQSGVCEVTGKVRHAYE
jgi:hypothetical protein